MGLVWILAKTVLRKVGIGRVAAGELRQPNVEQSEQKPFSPEKGTIVRLEAGRGLKSNVDYFIPKESPSNLIGEYLGYEEGNIIEGLGWKVEPVDLDWNRL